MEDQHLVACQAMLVVGIVLREGRQGDRRRVAGPGGCVLKLTVAQIAEKWQRELVLELHQTTEVPLGYITVSCNECGWSAGGEI